MPLPQAMLIMNESMGIVGEGTLPMQVDLLVEIAYMQDVVNTKPQDEIA